MAELLAIPIPNLATTLTTVKRGFSAAYSGFVTRSGRTLSAFTNDSLLYALGIVVARRDDFFYTLARETGSQAWPGGATGPRLDQWTELMAVTIPTPQAAQLTIAITASNNETLAAGDFVAGIANGKRYTLDSPVAFGAPESTIAVNVTAENPGRDYNLGIGDEVGIESISDFITVNAPVTAILATGQDPTNEEQKSERLRDAFAARGTFRTEAYYRDKLRTFDGAIGEVFVDPAGAGAGTVVLYPLLVLTDLQALNTPWSINPPTSGQASAWTALMVEPEVRGVNDAPIVRVINVPWIEHTLQLTPNSADAQAAADKALRERYAIDRSASGFTIPNSEIIGAITTAPGVDAVTIVDIQPSVQVGHEATTDNVPNPGPTSDVVALHGELIEPAPVITFV